MFSRARAIPFLAASLAACISTPSSVKPSSEPTAAEAPHTVIEDVSSTTGAPTADEVHGFAAASNAFGGDLYKELSSRPGNFTLSPASVSMALAMTWTGARGKTRDEMTKVLHLGSDPKAMTASAGKLLASFNDPKKTDYTLSVVNRLFGEKTLAFEPDFLAVTKNDFSAPFSLVDFKHASEPARLDINAWVEKQTHDKIQDLLPPGSLTDITRLVLVNAIYLHADWANPFAKEATAAQPFHLGGDKTVDVQTMHDDKMLRFADADGVKVVDMPYKGSDLSMTFLLPDDANQLAALEQKVEQGGIDGLVLKEQQKLVRMSLPKFKVASSAAIMLSDPLKKLGMPDAFIDGGADFSGMSKAEALHIAEAYHKAFVAIDEKGTEAAAATAVVIDGEAAIMPAQPQAEFNADHPFLFAIRDTKSGMILFLGRVANPSA